MSHARGSEFELTDRGLGALACGLLLVGCEAKPPSVQSSPDIERLEVCAREITAIQAANPRDRSSSIAAHLSSSGPACMSIVVAGCEPEHLDSDSNAVAQLDVQRRLCIERVCPDLDPRPGLCDDPDATTASTESEVVDLLTEFLAAKLANQLALERDDARVLEVARAYAGIWVAPIMLARIRVSPPRYETPDH